MAYRWIRAVERGFEMVAGGRRAVEALEVLLFTEEDARCMQVPGRAGLS